MDETAEKFWNDREKHCKVCGKYFIAMYPELYVFKRGRDFYCGNHCYEEDDKRNKKKVSKNHV